LADNNCKACKHYQNLGMMGVCRRFPQYQNRHHTEICGEFSAFPVIPVETNWTITVHDEPKKRGRPKAVK
jgi:hypothetical protein